jgi:hypothetical protein
MTVTVTEPAHDSRLTNLKQIVGTVISKKIFTVLEMIAAQS